MGIDSLDPFLSGISSRDVKYCTPARTLQGANQSGIAHLPIPTHPQRDSFMTLVVQIPVSAKSRMAMLRLYIKRYFSSRP
jgi:hypothetical protein